MENYYTFSKIGEFVNIGIGDNVTISELVELMKEIVGFEGKTNYDTLKPDGTPRKLMDVSGLMDWDRKSKFHLKIELKKLMSCIKIKSSERF
jgi:GDP-L-fucose synthase